MSRAAIGVLLSLLATACGRSTVYGALPEQTFDSGPGPSYQLTLTVLGFDGGVGAVTWVDGGTCAGICTATLPGGTVVSLTALPSTRSGFGGWSGDCTGDGLACPLTFDADHEVTAAFSPLNIAFVTSIQLAPGTLGGLDGGDLLCNAVASDAGLAGHFVAWLSTSTVTASSRIPSGTRGWMRVDGLPIVDALSDLIGPSHHMLYPLRLDERGENAHLTTALAAPIIPPSEPLVATGTKTDGTASGKDCSGWTQPSAEWTGGIPSGGETLWTDFDTGFSCAAAASLDCLQIDFHSQPAPPDAGGRIGFVTTGIYASTTGVQVFDDACAAEASDAGLSGNFFALVSLAPGTAASRFSASGPPFVRADGVSLGDTAADFLGAVAWPLTTFDVTASGASLSSEPFALSWTGGSAINAAGTSSCNGWTADGGTGTVGAAALSDSLFFSGYGEVPCGAPEHLYCLEE